MKEALAGGGTEKLSLLQPQVLRPLVVCLGLVTLLQLSGQGPVTQYTALLCSPTSSLPPNDCALAVGLTFLASATIAALVQAPGLSHKQNTRLPHSKSAGNLFAFKIE